MKKTTIYSEEMVDGIVRLEDVFKKDEWFWNVPGTEDEIVIRARISKSIQNIGMAYE